MQGTEVSPTSSTALQTWGGVPLQPVTLQMTVTLADVSLIVTSERLKPEPASEAVPKILTHENGGINVDHDFKSLKFGVIC